MLQVIDFTMIIFDLNCFWAFLEKPVTDLVVDTEIVNVEVLDHDDETEKAPIDFWSNYEAVKIRVPKIWDKWAAYVAKMLQEKSLF